MYIHFQKHIWSLHHYFLACVMHQSFVATDPSPPPPPHLRGWAWLMCGAVTFLITQCRVSAGLVILCKYTPFEFTIIKSGAMTLSKAPQCRAFSRAVIDEKSLFPLFPVGGGEGGAVVTNDWCFTVYIEHRYLRIDIYLLYTLHNFLLLSSGIVFVSS